MAPVGEKPLVSVVIPVLDEEPVLEELHAGLATLAGRDDLGVEFEFVFVDDGSSDGSREVLAGLASLDPRVRVVVLSRNFGQEAACAAGLDHARGQALVVMDADLQDPPDLVAELVARWREGHDVVHARRLGRRGEGLLKRAAAFAFYRFMSLDPEARLVTDAGTFRLLDRRIVEALGPARDRGRFLRGLACWAGGNQAVVDFHRDPRRAGRSKYGPGRQLALAMDGLTSFSALPLRLVGCTGLVLACAGLAAIAAALVVRALAPSGGLACWLLGGGLAAATGLVMGGLWIVGEYVYRLGREARGLPLYIVTETIGFGGREQAGPPGR